MHQRFNRLTAHPPKIRTMPILLPFWTTWTRTTRIQRLGGMLRDLILEIILHQVPGMHVYRPTPPCMTCIMLLIMWLILWKKRMGVKVFAAMLRKILPNHLHECIILPYNALQCNIIHSRARRDPHRGSHVADRVGDPLFHDQFCPSNRRGWTRPPGHPRNDVLTRTSTTSRPRGEHHPSTLRRASRT